jgi:large subunit ribosomal protein L15
MKQNELKPPAGSKRNRKRIGRGDGTGYGSYSGRGVKGEKARSGGRVRPGFEGGQLPISKRLPHRRGFTNIFKTEYSIVNLGKLTVFAPGSKVGPQELVEAGLIKSVRRPIKILSDGEIDQPLAVRADKISAAARRKIVAAGGSIEEIPDAT